jgi:hypothetical protein
MTPKFQDGQRVKYAAHVLKYAPKYEGYEYTILAATAEWSIGGKNEWYGEYLALSPHGQKVVVRESSLEAA